MENETILAHYDKENGNKQGLKNHLFNVAQNAKKYASSIGQGDVLYLIGLFHDLGKSDQLFQDKLKNNTNKHVNHSYAGAKYLTVMISKTLHISNLEVKLFTDIVSYVISAHHGMFDVYYDDGTQEAVQFHFNKLYKRRERADEFENYHFSTDVVSFAKQIEDQLQYQGYRNLTELIRKSFRNFNSAWHKLSPRDEDESAYYSGCMVRLYLSLLKNADIVDTINAYDLVLENKNENPNLIETYYSSVEKLYDSFGKPKSLLNRIRTNIAERVKLRGDNDSVGIYRMNLPTGAGKTNLSLRYATHQMLNQGKKRFFYITPYLSVLEQNAAAMKKIIGEDGVLEHHSNVIQKYGEDDELQIKADEINEVQAEYLIDSWDSPVVLTSMVQFFQTLFKTKSANLRRFSSLIDSVVILDEIQSLPIEVTSIFNLSMNFITSIMNTTVVLCTATQPVYDSKAIKHQLVYGGKNAEPVDLVTISDEERKVFTRTILQKFDESDAKTSLVELSEYILEKQESILVIVNTKTTVSKLYHLLIEKTELPIYQLSTNMCPQHRLDIIEEIKDKLNSDRPLICISTQLIEAGVDVDFDHVIRSYAGIDSIVQAAGRCNREGKKKLGQVTLVNLNSEDENLSHLKEIRTKKDATELILFQNTSLDNISELNTAFFEKYYSKNQNKMDYPLSDGESVFDYLSQNKFVGPKLCGSLRQSFKKAGQKMNLINDESIGVLVSYGKAREKLRLLETELETNPYPKGEELLKIKNILAMLQPYTVNLREGDERLKATRAYLNNQIMILQEEYYDGVEGIKKEAGSLIF